MLLQMLKRAGFTDVVEAVDGKDALAKMEVDNFNFVITDWNMPEMNGYDFVCEVRKDAQYNDMKPHTGTIYQ